MKSTRYIHCSADEVPADDLRWDVTPATAGKAIEVSFGGPFLKTETEPGCSLDQAAAAPHGPGAPFKRIRNLEAATPPTYFKLDGAAPSDTSWRALKAADEKQRASARAKRGSK